MVLGWLFGKRGNSSGFSDHIDAAEFVRSQQNFCPGLPATYGRQKERVMVPVSGIELDRALAQDAIREARRAAALRGEVLANNDSFFDDSDMEIDVPVHIQTMEATDEFPSQKPMPAEHDTYSQGPRSTDQQKEQDATAPDRTTWHQKFSSPVLAASAVALGTAIGLFITS